jgi:hypothetical protein
MVPTRALYCVVQSVPDDGRAEAANAGVLLYVPSLRWLEVQLTPSLARIRQFFRPSKQELHQIASALESLKHRMKLARSEFETESDLTQFVSARADAVRLTPPQVMMVEDPSSDLESLYAELVGEKTHLRNSSAPTLPPGIAEVFGRLETQKKGWRPGSIVVPTVNRRFDVPMAFQNGRVNYIRPESLARREKLDARMYKLGFHGQLIFQHPVENKPSQLIVLSSDPKANREAERRFRESLGEFHVRFVPFDEAEAFAAEVEKTAHYEAT